MATFEPAPNSKLNLRQALPACLAAKCLLLKGIGESRPPLAAIAWLMSTSENAATSNNAVPEEASSTMPTEANSSSVESTISPTIMDQPSAHPPRFDSLKDPLPSPAQIDGQFFAVSAGDPEESEASSKMQHVTGQVQQLSIDTGKQTAGSVSHVDSMEGPEPPAKDAAYLDPTPKTPQTSRPVSRRPSDYGEYNEKDAPFEQDLVGSGTDVDKAQPEPAVEEDSQPEIQSIMEQFTGDGEASSKDRIMSPRMELASPTLATPPHFPPRRSSLEPLRPKPAIPLQDSEKELPSPPVPPKADPGAAMSPPRSVNPSTTPSLSEPPPPEPEPELPFDFHRFLEQLRHKSADPVAGFLRSFLTEFGKKQWLAHEQVKIIGDFLAFIANKMALCEVWRGTSEAEFDNAKEGMEKLVMNRLYAQTFSPAIPAAPAQRNRGKRKEAEKFTGRGRRGQHQEDIERDDILAQKVRIYGWVTEQHLDIAPVGPSGERFLKLAQQEMLKIKGYRAPRDKVICVLNCCKVIFGLLKSSKTGDTSADAFVPLLIYVVLKANPDHLVSNIQYILRFRNQDKLGGEAGYYLSSLSGAIQFIESLDRTSLSITDEEFERNVELAVSAIAEKNREAEPRLSGTFVAEKSSISEPEVVPRTSMDATRASPSKRLGRSTNDGHDGMDDGDAVAGLLRTIQRPLSTIGRMFSEDANPHSRAGPVSTPQPGSTPKLSPSVFQPPRHSDEQGRPQASGEKEFSLGEKKADVKLDAQEAAARQASAEAAQARKIQRVEHHNVVEYVVPFSLNLR